MQVRNKVHKSRMRLFSLSHCGLLTAFQLDSIKKGNVSQRGCFSERIRQSHPSKLSSPFEKKGCFKHLFRYTNTQICIMILKGLM